MPAIVANELQDMQLRSAHVTDEVSDASADRTYYCSILHSALVPRRGIANCLILCIISFSPRFSVAEIADFPCTIRFVRVFLFAVSGEHPSDDRTLRRGT